MPGDNSAILNLARRLRSAVDAVAVGGIAVYLHGVPRSTVDLDLYTVNRSATALALEAIAHAGTKPSASMFWKIFQSTRSPPKMPALPLKKHLSLMVSAWSRLKISSRSSCLAVSIIPAATKTLAMWKN